MNVVAIVQARMGSSRLPGKSLLPLWRDMSLLELVLQRVRAARHIDLVVLATTTSPADASLQAIADSLGIPVTRGSEDDVLGRFSLALAAHPSDAAVRVCADNPFVDPGELDRLVEHFELTGCDYAANTTEASGIPDGAGGEIVRSDILERAAAKTEDPYEREHVTSYVTRRQDEFTIEHVPPPEQRWPFLKLDIDTKADYHRLREVAERLPEAGAPLWPLDVIVRAYRA